jgi:hypothetical protein
MAYHHIGSNCGKGNAAKRRLICMRMKQVGFIIFGAGLNQRTAIQQAKQEGYDVRKQHGYATLYKTSKS